MRQARSDNLLHKTKLETYSVHHNNNNYNVVSAVGDILPNLTLERYVKIMVGKM